MSVASIYRRVAIVSVACVVVSGCSNENVPAGNPDAGDDSKSVAVTVLIDLSRSFVPSSPADMGRTDPLANDIGALRALNRVLVERSSSFERLKIVWSRIGSASLAENLLCPPIEMRPSLLKNGRGSIASADALADTLEATLASIAEKMRDPRFHADYTDIGGALAIASKAAGPTYAHRYIVVLSDFIEDLPQRRTSVSFELHGETVVLLHRVGFRYSGDLDSHLANVGRWVEHLRQAGAGRVVAIPVQLMSKLLWASLLEGQPIGTQINVLLADARCFEHDLSRRLRDVVSGIAIHIASRSDTTFPIAARWLVTDESGLRPRVSSAVEYIPTLIKNGKSVSRPRDFTAVLDTVFRREVACWVPHNEGLATTLRMLASPAISPARSCIVVVGSLSSHRHPIPETVHCPRRTCVLLINLPSGRESGDQIERELSRWKYAFRRGGAEKVYEIQLATFTPDDLEAIEW
ncbi:MAG: hypothetical protein N3B17_00740 [Chlorobi bacterium]|nr:hypothetical protein [Chlorobiota bacterium]